jgi:hypothetical protein
MMENNPSEFKKVLSYETICKLIKGNAGLNITVSDIKTLDVEFFKNKQVDDAKPMF